MKLNLGCGHDIRDGYVNVDIVRLGGVNLIADLNNFLPFKNNTIDEIIIINTLEHLENGVKAIEEIHRILKPGGKVLIRVPHFSNPHVTWTDPTHKRPYGYYSFHYFVKHENKSKRPYETLSHEVRVHFSSVKSKLIFPKRYRFWNKLLEPLFNRFPYIYEYGLTILHKLFPCVEIEVIMVK